MSTMQSELSKSSSRKDTFRNPPSMEQGSLFARRELTAFERQILVAKLTSLAAVSKAYVKILKDSVNKIYADELENLLSTTYDALEFTMNAEGKDQKNHEPPTQVSAEGVNPKERSVG